MTPWWNTSANNRDSQNFQPAQNIPCLWLPGVPIVKSGWLYCWIPLFYPHDC